MKGVNSTEIRVPAEHIVAVAKAISDAERVSVNVKRSDLEVIVTNGEMELVDRTGSYGVRRWGRGGVR